METQLKTHPPSKSMSITPKAIPPTVPHTGPRIRALRVSGTMDREMLPPFAKWKNGMNLLTAARATAMARRIAEREIEATERSECLLLDTTFSAILWCPFLGKRNCPRNLWPQGQRKYVLEKDACTPYAGVGQQVQSVRSLALSTAEAVP